MRETSDLQPKQEQNVVVRVLSFAGCPHVEQTMERVWAALRAEGLTAGHATVEQVEVTGEAMARRLGFLGSPSVQVNGRDVEVGARGSEAVGFGCRTYVGSGVGSGVEQGKRTGVPPLAAIRSALREGLEEARRAAHADAAEAAVDSGAEG